MESERLTGSEEKALESSVRGRDVIKVRATMKCPSCTFKKAFKNQYARNQIELMVVSLKVFDWMCCTRCGELLNLDLEFDI